MVAFFVNKHAAVFSFAVLVVIVGLMSYSSLPRESTPEIKQPYIFVTTLYQGVGAKDVENLVTTVIEEEIDGLEGLSEITSSSQQSLSFIFVEFTSDVEQEVALRRIRERVDIAKSQLPDDAEEPIVQEFSSSNWPILITVLSHKNGLHIINDAAESMQDQLKRVHGVLDVKVSGKLEKEVLIEVDPQKLEHFEFSLGTVINAIRNENVAIPGGNLKSDSKNFTLNVTGEIKDVAQFEDIIVKANGVQVRLGELANVTFGWTEPETYSRLNGEPCITLNMTKRAGENIVDIVDDAKVIVEQMKTELPVGTTVSFSYDGSSVIRDLITDLENNILTAFCLVLIVTIFFLGFLNALFVSIAIPFSMLMSFFVLQAMGITLNMVVLFSLVLALGMLVDNGIVIVENIFRHAAKGASRRTAAIEGSQEVAWPIIASTATTIVAFMPLIFMPGVMGDFLSFLPKTVIVVLSCSLFVALTINPVFCATFLSISQKNRKKIIEGSGIFILFQKWYERRVYWAIDNSIIVIAISVMVFLSGIFMYVTFGKEPIFFPAMDPETGIIELVAPQGTPLDSTDRLVKLVEDMVPKIPSSLKNFMITTGRGSSDNKFGGMGDEFHKANIRVEYKPFLEREIMGKVAIDSLRVRLANFTGAEVNVAEIEMGPPTGNDISYQVTGYDYEVLGRIADSVHSILRRFPELKIVDYDFESAKPEISIKIDRKIAAFYGLSTAEVASTIRNTINGTTVGTFKKGADEFDINVRYSKNARNSISKLSGLHIVNHDDERIPLGSLAKITQSSSVGVIQRRNLDRAVQIWGDFHDDIQNKKSVISKIDSLVKELSIDDGYYVGKGGGLEIRTEAQQYLQKSFLIAVFLVFIILIAQFNSILQPIIIMLTVLLSFGGVFWGYFLTNQNFIIIMSGIGLIALTGVVVNNCIVLIDYTNLLIRNGIGWHDAIIEAAKTRLRPVILTAITTILGMFPMAIGVSFDFHDFTLQLGSESGQMWVAFAWAMIYGLSFATTMTLLIVPAFLSLQFQVFPPKNKQEI